jgi:hypothetical protein
MKIQTLRPFAAKVKTIEGPTRVNVLASSSDDAFERVTDLFAENGEIPFPGIVICIHPIQGAAP